MIHYLFSDNIIFSILYWHFSHEDEEILPQSTETSFLHTQMKRYKKTSSNLK